MWLVMFANNDDEPEPVPLTTAAAAAGDDDDDINTASRFLFLIELVPGCNALDWARFPLVGAGPALFIVPVASIVADAEGCC